MKHDYRFYVAGDPISCPRMTRADVWKKRPAVLRYREYADRIRAATGGAPLQDLDVQHMKIFFYFAPPASMSAKKKRECAGKLMRVRPDIDNLVKGVLDAMFSLDSSIASIEAVKRYVAEGTEPHTVIYLYCSLDLYSGGAMTTEIAGQNARDSIVIP